MTSAELNLPNSISVMTILDSWELIRCRSIQMKRSDDHRAQSLDFLAVVYMLSEERFRKHCYIISESL